MILKDQKSDIKENIVRKKTYFQKYNEYNEEF